MNSKYRQISRKINRLAKKDQDLRNIVFAKGHLITSEESEQIHSLDYWNSKILSEIIEEYGLISISKFGKNTSKNAWLIIQHAVHNLPLMKKYLRLMKKNLKEVNPKNIAFLTDVVLLLQNKPQIYGTRVTNSIENPHVFTLMKLKYSIIHTNKLRKKLGLNSIEEYLKEFN